MNFVCKRLLSGSRPHSQTVKEVLSGLTQKFEAAQIPEAAISAKYLLSHSLNVQKLDDLSKIEDKSVEQPALETLEVLSQCRLARMPIQYIIKSWDFRHLNMKMQPPVFIPRPETEQLIDIILPHLKKDHKILEIGCGSGPICLSLLKEFPDMNITAIDQSKQACILTSENALLNNIDMENLNVLNLKLTDDGITELENEEYDFIVSNPPYVLRKDLMELEPEIAVFEDLRALDGGSRGVSTILPLLEFASRTLKDDGKLFLEVDPCHPHLIPKYVDNNDKITLKVDKVHKDFNDHERFMTFVKNN